MATMSTMIAWPYPLPDLTITEVRSTSRNCFHETWYEIVSRRPLSEEVVDTLSDCGLLGSGQAYNIEKIEAFTMPAEPAVIDRKTGRVVVGMPPINSYTGQLTTHTVDYDYHRYTVRRICDSGD